MTHTFQQHKAVRSWLDYAVLEQQCLLTINYIYEFEPNVVDKEEVCQRFRNMAEEAHRNVIVQRELYFNPQTI